MHNSVVAGVLSVMMAVAAVPVAAQVAGSTTIGVAPDEVKTLARGWSAKKQILDKPVYNDRDERVGEVEDLIITPDKALSDAIIGVGGFLSLGTLCGGPREPVPNRGRENRAPGRDEGHAQGDAALRPLTIRVGAGSNMRDISEREGWWTA